MTTLDQTEIRLAAALAIDLSADDIHRLDERIGRAMARPAASHRFAMPGARWFLRPLPLLAAIALLSGTVIGAASLLDRLVESQGMPGWRAAWEQAEVLDLEQTDDDVTIHLVRAYADLNQVLIGFTVSGLGAAPTADDGDAPALEWTAELLDPAGRSAETWATVRAGTGIDAADVSANVHTWDGHVTPDAGTWILTFTSVGYGGGTWTPGECDVDSTDPACADAATTDMVEGTWRFAFDLAAPSGVAVTPGIGATKDAATITLTELRISDTMIHAALALHVDGEEVDAWGWTEQEAVIRHDDASFAFTIGAHVTMASEDRGPLGDINEFLASAVIEEPAGQWEIEIPEIWYSVVGDETDIRLDGPWTITVDVP